MASVASPSPTLDYYYNTTLPVAPDDTTNASAPCFDQPWCVSLVVIRAIILLLGAVGNGLVIWIIGFKMKQKTVTTTWYLSLAVSDILFIATLPFNLHHTATRSWTFGRFMCKFTYFLYFLNMFSSIFMMVVISVDRCVGVVFAFWARNNRTMRRAALAVAVAWLFALVLSVPSLVVRDVVSVGDHVKCYNNYETLPSGYTGIPVFRFVLGFVFPVVIIVVCYSVIIVRLRNNRMARTARSARPFKVMTALIVTFVVCWLPYHIFMLAGINYFNTTAIAAGRLTSMTLAMANSCMNPFLYASLGKDVKLSRLVSKIENAFKEERKCHEGTVVRSVAPSPRS